MPELPEVEHYRRVAHEVAVGRRVTEAFVAPDEIVLEGVAPARVAGALRDRVVTGTGRHGKHLWLELDRRPWVTFHFGMTGTLSSPRSTPLALASGIDGGPSWPPRFTKLHLAFDDGGALAFTNARRLGRVRLREVPREEPPIAGLGFDPHLEMPPPAVFVDRVRRRSIPIKALLLDQSFAAGVGNWIADEALYQARIDPRRSASALSELESRKLRSVLRRILTQAVAVDARADEYPRSWLFHRRWGKKEGVTLGGGVIEHLEIAGRTTAWVPARQR